MKREDSLAMCMYACCLGLMILFGIGKLTARELHLTPPEAICFQGDSGQQCIPLSVMKTTFAGYQDGAPAPTNALRQDLITTQGQLAETLKQFRNCEGTLGPLQAEQHGKLLQQQQNLLDTDNAKAAPDGTAWDPKAQKYVPKPAQAPAPPATPKKDGGK